MKLPRAMLEHFNRILNEFVFPFFKQNKQKGKNRAFEFSVSVTGHFSISTHLSFGFSLPQLPACKID